MDSGKTGGLKPDDIRDTVFGRNNPTIWRESPRGSRHGVSQDSWIPGSGLRPPEDDKERHLPPEDDKEKGIRPGARG